jgi:polysaccharide export outer membrane protein
VKLSLCSRKRPNSDVFWRPREGEASCPVGCARSSGSQRRVASCVASCLPLLAMLVSIAVGGCATTSKAPPNLETGTVRLEKLALSEEAGVWEAGHDRIGWEVDSYRLQPGDELEIHVLYNNDLFTVTRVLPDGTISAPVIGQVEASDKTPNEVAAVIAAGLSQYIVEPKVSVILRRLAGNYVFVIGEVRSQGAYEILGPLTVTQAIAKAGGATNTAKLNSVLVIRRTSPDTVAGMRVNVDWLLKNRVSSKDRIVRAYDIVYVPPTFIGKVDAFLEQFFNKTSSPWLWYIWARSAIRWEGVGQIGTPAPR